jgi:uncharacterized membrane protein
MRSITRRVTEGESSESPAATVRTAAISSSGRVRLSRNPEAPARKLPKAIFCTRWITHFCAPIFVLTVGLGAYFWMTRGHHSKGELSRLLLSRGIWLIILEFTILRVIFFSQISFTKNPVILIILWAIGICMIALAGLIYLPTRVIAALSRAIIALHNLLDRVSAARFGRSRLLTERKMNRD